MKRPDLFKPGQPADVVSTDEGYDRWASIYDDDFNVLVQLEQPLVIEMLTDVAGLEVVVGVHGRPIENVRQVFAGPVDHIIHVQRVLPLAFAAGQCQSQ